MCLGEPFIRGKAEVADNPVGPEIDHVDFQPVARRPQGTGDLNAPWGAPEDAEFFAVQSDFGNIFHIAKIKKNPFCLCFPIQVESFPVGGSSGVIPDSVLGSLCPADEIGKLSLCRSSPCGVERNLPRAIQLRLFGKLRVIVSG